MSESRNITRVGDVDFINLRKFQNLFFRKLKKKYFFSRLNSKETYATKISVNGFQL
jgi:hypothetical protein